MLHKDIIDELKAHEPAEQPGKPAQKGDKHLKENLDKTIKEAENLKTCSTKSSSKNDDTENLCQEIEQLKEQLLRASAEMQNTKMRAERDINNAHKFALEKFAKALLPIVDNLERALENNSENNSHTEGVKLTHQMFLSTLEKFGVVQIDPLNQPFDPEHHEALSAQPKGNVKKDTIIQVFEKGYLLNNRLIRPAKVIVAA